MKEVLIKVAPIVYDSFEATIGAAIADSPRAQASERTLR
jgi:dsRNA-specific ribonuclease